MGALQFNSFWSLLLAEKFASWNIRFYGLAYKLPNVNTSDLDSIIDGLSTDNLNSTETSLLQNRTQDLASIPVPKANLTAIVMQNGTNVTTTPIVLNTADDVGEIDQFVTVPNLNSSSSGSVQVVETGLLNVSGEWPLAVRVGTRS